MRFRLLVVVVLVLAAVLAPPASSGWPDGIAWAALQDPPARVGRLNYLRGSVSFAPRGVNEWASAILNYPLTTGDSLWSDEQSRAEFHVGSTVIRMDQSTALEILNLDDDTLQLRMSQGTINVDLHEVVAGEHFEVDTPTAAVSLLQRGDYRLDVNVDGTSVQVTVRTGDAEITTSPYDFHVYPGQAAAISRSGTNLSYDIHPAAPPDAFDQWATARERQEQIALQEARYVPSTMTGFGDLTQFGTWQAVPGIGPVCKRGGHRSGLGAGCGSSRGDGPGSLRSPGALRRSTLAAGCSLAACGHGCPARWLSNPSLPQPWSSLSSSEISSGGSPWRRVKCLSRRLRPARRSSRGSTSPSQM